MESTLIDLSPALKKGLVRIAGLGTALPPLRVTQKDALEFALTRLSLSSAAQVLYKRTFQNKSIESRHFALAELPEILDVDLDHLNDRFQKWAVRLSTESLMKALRNAALAPHDLDFLAVGTCTGYLCPGLSSYLVESCRLRSTIHLADLVGMGCGAAPPAWEQAYNFVSAHPGSTAAVVNTEICTAAMFFDEAPDIVISNAIFADGSGAVILKSRGEDRNGRYETGRDSLSLHIKAFSTLILPEWRESIRFRRERGYLRNVLSKEVPAHAAAGIQRNLSKLLGDWGLEIKDIKHWILHPGGGKILEAVQATLGLPLEALQASRSVLRNFGNMSSATVLFVLEEGARQNPPAPGDWGIVCSFGAGFTVYAVLVQYDQP